MSEGTSGPAHPAGRGQQDPSATKHVVEVALRADYSDVRGLSARVRDAAAALRATGTPVRFVRAVYLPEEGACLLVFEAPSSQAARDAAGAAGLEISTISTAMKIEKS